MCALASVRRPAPETQCGAMCHRRLTRGPSMYRRSPWSQCAEFHTRSVLPFRFSCARVVMADSQRSFPWHKSYRFRSQLRQLFVATVLWQLVFAWPGMCAVLVADTPPNVWATRSTHISDDLAQETWDTRRCGDRCGAGACRRYSWPRTTYAKCGLRGWGAGILLGQRTRSRACAKGAVSALGCQGRPWNDAASNCLWAGVACSM